MEEEVRIGRTADGRLDVVLAGEIDYLNAPALAERVRAAVLEQPAALVRVDLTAVTFLDSSGLGVLVVAYRAATAAGAGYRVDGPQPVVYEQLRLAGLVDLFDVDAPTGPSAPNALTDMT